MVKRRKFLIGAGSLLAGGAAATGTGALTNSESERGLKGRIASDKRGYVAFRENGGAPHHKTFVTYDSDGEITLDFDQAGDDGKGLNPDSKLEFRSVFVIENQNAAGNQYQEYEVWIESPDPDLDFFTNTGSITGEENAVIIDRGESVPVGVSIDLRDEDMAGGETISDRFGSDDEFIVHVERTLTDGNT